MTNGEKIKEIFPNGLFLYKKNWLNAEYKEPSSSEIPTDSIIDWNNCHTSEQLNSISTTKNDLAVDAISREAVNELVSSQRLDTFSDEGRKWANIKIDVILRGLKELPSVTPQPRKGRWIECMPGGAEEWCYKCSECNFWKYKKSINLSKFKFCPNCGAKMIEPQESEKT